MTNQLEELQAQLHQSRLPHSFTTLQATFWDNALDGSAKRADQRFTITFEAWTRLPSCPTWDQCNPQFGHGGRFRADLVPRDVFLSRVSRWLMPKGKPPISAEYAGAVLDALSKADHRSAYVGMIKIKGAGTSYVDGQFVIAELVNDKPVRTDLYLTGHHHQLPDFSSRHYSGTLVRRSGAAKLLECRYDITGETPAGWDTTVCQIVDEEHRAKYHDIRQKLAQALGRL